MTVGRESLKCPMITEHLLKLLAQGHCWTRSSPCPQGANVQKQREGTLLVQVTQTLQGEQEVCFWWRVNEGSFKKQIPGTPSGLGPAGWGDPGSWEKADICEQSHLMDSV